MSAESIKHYYTCNDFHEPPVEAEPHSKGVIAGGLIYKYNFECWDHAPKEYERQCNKIREYQTAMKAKWEDLFDRNQEWAENEAAGGPAKKAKLQRFVLGFQNELDDLQEEEDGKLKSLWEIFERRWGPDFLEERGRTRSRQ